MPYQYSEVPPSKTTRLRSDSLESKSSTSSTDSAHDAAPGAPLLASRLAEQPVYKKNPQAYTDHIPMKEMGGDVRNKSSDDLDRAQSETTDQTQTGHGDAIWETRDTYGPPGLRGLFSSPYVAACAAFSALGGLLFGYDQGVVSVILVMPQFLSRFDRIADAYPNSGFWKGLLTAMIELGAFIGAFNQGWIADKISRKYSIVVAVVIFTIGSVLQTGSTNYGMLTVARFIGGVGIGMLSMVAPLYISEISPPEIRGALLVLEEFSIVLGIVIAYWITYGTQYIPSEWSWRLPFLLQLVPGFVLGFGIVLLPFSPRWLVSKGRDDEALHSLSRLRRVSSADPRAQAEWWDIKAEVRLQSVVQRKKHPTLFTATGDLLPGLSHSLQLEAHSWMDLFRTNCWRRTTAGTGIMFFQQMVGINALIYYAPSLFKSLGQDHKSQLLLAGILNVTQLVGVSTSIWTMDRLGRKPLLLYGALLMFISHLAIAIIVGLFSSSWSTHSTQGWLGSAFLFLYMLSFGATWGPVPWAYPAEIFPSSLRAKGVALATCTNWMMNFVVGLITPPLIQRTGFGTYVFFAVWCLVAVGWTAGFIQETRGRRLEEMDAVFGDRGGEADRVLREGVVREMRGERETMEGVGDGGGGVRERVARHGGFGGGGHVVGEED